MLLFENQNILEYLNSLNTENPATRGQNLVDPARTDPALQESTDCTYPASLTSVMCLAPEGRSLRLSALNLSQGPLTVWVTLSQGVWVLCK